MTGLGLRVMTFLAMAGCCPLLVAAPPIPDKQQKACDITMQYRRAVNEFAITKSQHRPGNPIQEAQHPLVAPDPKPYDQEMLALMGQAGEFKDWYGVVSINVSDDRFVTHGKVVGVTLGISCGQLGMGQVLIALGTVTHPPGPSRNDFGLPYNEQYGMLPISGPLAADLGKETPPIHGTMSGHIAFRPAGGAFAAGYSSCMVPTGKMSVEDTSGCYLAHFDSFHSMPR